ncbi:MAG: NAD(P)/FAD-dependent oxidoreductase [Proteobacteria bacterium]|nr:NAD(P)/FAD-dependent oxidoreductase [Pseudomonadota bacterium]
MNNRYVIIGASAAGIAAATKLRQLDQEAEIVVVSQETDLPYNKCFLADYLSEKKTQSALLLKQADFFKAQHITLKLGVRVTALAPSDKKIILQDGTHLDYSKLLLAMGGSIVMPEIQGVENVQGIFQFYTLQDTQNILDAVATKKAQRVVIIGAGLSGLECADSLHGKVGSITVIERAAHVLFTHIADDAADFIHTVLEKSGINVRLNQTVVKVFSEQGKLQAVQLADGSVIETDLLICALGARPNSWLAEAAGIAVMGGAIVTDSFLKTSDDAIYAAGDVAQITDKITGGKVKSCSWPDALQQGAVAASNMAGFVKEYGGSVLIVSSSFFGIKFFSCGDVKAERMSDNASLRKTNESFRLIFHKNRVVKGFLLVGQTHNILNLKQSVLTGSQYDFSELI